MGTANQQIEPATGPGNSQDVRKSHALQTLRGTRLKRAVDVYNYIVDTLQDHGEQILTVKEVNTNLQGTRQLLSTVQTVHRLKRDENTVLKDAQLSEFAQTQAISDQTGSSRKILPPKSKK